MRLRVFDTTLRDGDQAAGFAFPVGGKIAIARALADAGVDVIEAGFPLSSQADAASCAGISDMLSLRPGGPAVAVMCRSLPDEIVRSASVFGGNTRTILHLSLPVSDLHIRAKFGTGRSDVLSRAVDAVTLARSLASEIEMGAEDATRADREFLREYCDAVTSAGARTVNIADTVGRALPGEIADLVAYLKKSVGAFRDGSSVISIHCHDDLGLALANTLAAVGAGCAQAELTSLGLGERAGNACLEELAAVLERRGDLCGFSTGLKPGALGSLSRLVSSYCGTSFSPLKSVSGSNAGAHASGIHQQGLARDPETYANGLERRFDGAPARIVLSRHSGKAGVESAAREWAGISLAGDAAVGLLGRIKAELGGAGPVFGVTEFLHLLHESGLVSVRPVLPGGVASRGTGWKPDEALAAAEKIFGFRMSVRALSVSGYGSGEGSGAGACGIGAVLPAGGRSASEGESGYSGVRDRSASAGLITVRFRCYLEACLPACPGSVFAVERVGTDAELLLLACLFDFANTRLCLFPVLTTLAGRPYYS